MAKIEMAYCEQCHDVTEHFWTRDPDSDDGEPVFDLKCLRCESS